MNTHITDLEYDYLLVNWDRNPEVFVQWATHVCGGNKNTIEQLSRLIKNDKELTNWIELFDGDLDNFEQTSKRFLEASTCN